MSDPCGRSACDDRGFSLVEMLVVLVIVSILSAIAIPYFVRQREKGWRAQMESALKSSATAIEAWNTKLDQSYDSASVAGLAASENLAYARTVTVELVEAFTDEAQYCFRASHANFDLVLYYDGDIGKALETECT